MNKEQVMNIQTLTDEQKERLESYFQMQSNLHKPLEINKNSEQEIIVFADNLITKYNKRKAYEAKKTAKDNAIKQRNKEIIETAEKALQYISKDEVIEAIEKAYKTKHNQQIQDKIRELQAKLMQ